MFDTLVESGSHSEDLARKGSFFLGTMVLYSIVLVAVAKPGTWTELESGGWEDVSLTYQHFVFFGDPALLAEIRRALSLPDEPVCMAWASPGW